MGEKKCDNQNNILKEVTAINTPGSVESGSTIVITWTWSYTLQANTFTGTLSVVDNVTKKSFIISSLIILATQSTLWVVNVPAGTYYLDINDGSGNKYSGTFTVFQAGGAAPAAAPSSSPATSAPAPSRAAPSDGYAPMKIAIFATFCFWLSCSQSTCACCIQWPSSSNWCFSSRPATIIFK
ncbi:hypothetical protein C2G38_2137411 [Gigaspora rosea]|uniref:Uncharacterized protein n=1 Tax=Gigaspora rosea TaxID=44941 RepID=A0A397W2N0_9GLOM|nr:hypothetical protein C2G38_2137411 [Gigaspora rosea]